MDRATGNLNRREGAGGGSGTFDASTLAERLRWEQQNYWLHLEATGPLEKYPAKQHARRVVEKLGVSEGFIYLAGEPTRNNEDSDMPAPYRQRRYFYYLSGCNEPDCHLAYNIQEDTLTLFIPRIDPSRVIWYGRGSTPGEAMDKYDIDNVLYVDQLVSFVDDFVKYYHGLLYILHPSQNPLKLPIESPIDTSALQPAMNLGRVVKDDYEIRLIKKANDISSQAHKEVLANILKFKSEAQVEGLFLDVCISKKAKEQAYHPIAASGPNAGTLHYDENNQDFDDRVLMVLDAGCEVELYASDITRTFPLSGNWPSKESKAIYDLVHRMQETCIEMLKPGVRYLDLHILAHQIAIDGLLQLGIFHNGTKEEIYKAGTSKAFFPHGLGHHVGLEVHDPGQGDLMSLQKGNPMYEMAPSLYPENFHLPVYDPKTCRSPVDVQSGHLEEGMVLTVEPGIYFSTYALNTFYLISPIHSRFINTEVVNRYLPVGGVRIEDDILITSKGHQNLTTAPKGEVMLEIIRSQNAQWPFLSESVDLGPVAGNTALLRKVSENEEESLLRAPGISQHIPEPILRPIQRASTAPVPRKNTVDFEPFQGPSLFSGFKRASTLDLNQVHRRSTLDPPKKVRDSSARTPVCGDANSDYIHAYLDFSARPEKAGAVSVRDQIVENKPTCNNCTLLMQTVERLRKNLANQGQASPKLPSSSRKNSNVVPEVTPQPREPLPFDQLRRVPSFPPTRTDSETALRTNLDASQSVIPIRSILNPLSHNDGAQSELPGRQSGGMRARLERLPGHCPRSARTSQEKLQKHNGDSELNDKGFARNVVGASNGSGAKNSSLDTLRVSSSLLDKAVALNVAPPGTSSGGLSVPTIPPPRQPNLSVPTFPASHTPSSLSNYELVCKECFALGQDCRMQGFGKSCGSCLASSKVCSLNRYDAGIRKKGGLQRTADQSRMQNMRGTQPNSTSPSKEISRRPGHYLPSYEHTKEEALERKEQKKREECESRKAEQWRQTVGFPVKREAGVSQTNSSSTWGPDRRSPAPDVKSQICIFNPRCICRATSAPCIGPESQNAPTQCRGLPGYNYQTTSAPRATPNQALATAQAKVQQLASSHGIPIQEPSRQLPTHHPLFTSQPRPQMQSSPYQQHQQENRHPSGSMKYPTPYPPFLFSAPAPPPLPPANIPPPSQPQSNTAGQAPGSTESDEIQALRKAMDEFMRAKVIMDARFEAMKRGKEGVDSDSEKRRIEKDEKVEGNGRRDLGEQGR